MQWNYNCFCTYILNGLNFMQWWKKTEMIEAKRWGLADALDTIFVLSSSFAVTLFRRFLVLFVFVLYFFHFVYVSMSLSKWCSISHKTVHYQRNWFVFSFFLLSIWSPPNNIVFNESGLPVYKNAFNQLVWNLNFTHLHSFIHFSFSRSLSPSTFRMFRVFSTTKGKKFAQKFTRMHVRTKKNWTHTASGTLYSDSVRYDSIRFNSIQLFFCCLRWVKENSILTRTSVSQILNSIVNWDNQRQMMIAKYIYAPQK